MFIVPLPQPTVVFSDHEPYQLYWPMELQHAMPHSILRESVENRKKSPCGKVLEYFLYCNAASKLLSLTNRLALRA